MFKSKYFWVMLLPLFMAAGGPNVDETSPGAGPNVEFTGPRWFYEQGTNPVCQADRGVVFTKEDGGVTELYYMTSLPACNVVQITTGGVSPVGMVEYVGLTTLTYDGNDKGSYTAITTQCMVDTADADARPYTDLDIALLVSMGETFGGLADEVWIMDGAPGFTSFSNDCDAWTSTAVGYYAGYWKLNSKQAYLSGCAMSKKYICCK